MPVQFPNFLSVPVRTPDFSGIGDIVDNFYRGKAMPKEDLMKAIQAEFARPNAEEALKSARLGNQKSGIDIRKGELDIQTAVRELAQQKMLEDQLRQALGGGGGMPASSGGGSMGNAPAAPPNAPASSPAASNAAPVMNPALGAALAQAAQNAQPQGGQQPSLSAGVPDNAYTPPTAPTQPAQSPIAPSVQSPSSPEQANLNEITVTKGSPHLAGIDAMYDSSPLSRQFLEKKGFKKSQDIKFDAKTGKTTIITKYPSGKVTVQSTASPSPSPEGIPLTNKMISQHQQMISAIDNAVPVINEIIDQKGFQPYPRSMGMGLVPGWMGQAATYDTLVKSALDTLMKAYGLPSTNEGISTVKDQLLIHHGETAGHYRNRLRGLLKDLQRRKEYSSNEVKKSNKIAPVDSSASGQSYSSDEWEVANDQQ